MQCAQPSMPATGKCTFHLIENSLAIRMSLTGFICFTVFKGMTTTLPHSMIRYRRAAHGAPVKCRIQRLVAKVCRLHHHRICWQRICSDYKMALSIGFWARPSTAYPYHRYQQLAICHQPYMRRCIRCT